MKPEKIESCRCGEPTDHSRGWRCCESQYCEARCERENAMKMLPQRLWKLGGLSLRETVRYVNTRQGEELSQEGIEDAFFTLLEMGVVEIHHDVFFLTSSAIQTMAEEDRNRAEWAKKSRLGRAEDLARRRHMPSAPEPATAAPVVDPPADALVELRGVRA